MPRNGGKDFSGSPKKLVRMSQEELDAVNEGRPPSDQIHRNFCPAKYRNGPRKGETCARPAGANTSHPGVGYCAAHGGNTPSGVKAAARAYGRELLLQQRERFGGDRTSVYVSNITAEQALLEEVRRSVAMVRWLEEKIGEWQIDPASGAELQESDGLGLPRLVSETSKGAPGATDVQAWLLLYREERAHAARVSKMAIDSGIAKRLVSIAEDQGKVLTTILKATLHALQLSEDQKQLLPQVVPGIVTRVSQQMFNPPSPDDNKPVYLPESPHSRTPYRG